MKIKCENVVICGNYGCVWNCDCRCTHDVVSLDANGKCALEKPRNHKNSTSHVGDPNESF